MAWRCFLFDVMTGLLGAEVEVPAFSWSVTVSDCSFDTTSGKGVGEGEASSVTLPWTALPGDTPARRGAEVAAGRRGLVLCWEDSSGAAPIVAGAIGERTDTYFDTSFSLDSPLAMLGRRYCVEEGVFGAGDGGTTTGYLQYTDMSFRGIASEVGKVCTDEKPGGALPIDWTYEGESGDHQRTYYAYNVSNISCAAIFDKLANVSGGPDIQLRPYLSDSKHVRWQLLAGSDADVYLGQDALHCIAEPNDVTVYHGAPYTRVYGLGSGSEEETLCYLAEDLSINECFDPRPLAETVFSDTSDDSLAEVQSAAEAQLAAAKVPLCQVECTVDAAQLPLGHAWPGEVFRVPIYGFPTLPSGDYDMRLMEMSGDEGRTVKLVFDVMEDPTY